MSGTAAEMLKFLFPAALEEITSELLINAMRLCGQEGI